MRRAVAIIALSVASAAAPVRANDSSFGGSGADLVPLAETRVRMVSEDIAMELAPEEVAQREGDGMAWIVHAKYRFENPTAERVRLQMGFPETRCDGEGDCTGRGGEFRDMTTTVRGRPVRQRIGSVSRREEWPGLGRVFVYDVTFQPNETVEIEHRYVYDRSRSVMGDHLSYLTKTGALWNGPIEHARFTVRTPYRPWMVVAPGEYRITSHVERTVEGKDGGVNETVFEARAFTPEEDFAVFLVSVFMSGAMMHGLEDCPFFYEPDDTEAFDAAPVETLRLCRALVYARHGKTFDDAALNERFYGEREPSEEMRVYLMGWESPSWVALRPNPEFSEALLTAEDRAYVAAIDAAIARKPESEETEPAGERAAIGEQPPPSPPAAAPRSGGCGSCSSVGGPTETFRLVGALVVLLLVRRLRRR